MNDLFAVDAYKTIQVTLTSVKTFEELIPVDPEADPTNSLTLDEFLDADLVIVTVENAPIRYSYSFPASDTFGHKVPVLNEVQFQFRRNIKRVTLASTDESLLTISFARLVRK